jgi:hypothetical protein
VTAAAPLPAVNLSLSRISHLPGQGVADRTAPSCRRILVVGDEVPRHLRINPSKETLPGLRRGLVQQRGAAKGVNLSR